MRATVGSYCSQAMNFIVTHLARIVACLLADPHLAAQNTDLLHKLVSASNRLLCDARRIRDGAFPAKGPNQPDEYYRQMAWSVYPSGCVMSLSDYSKVQEKLAERSQAAAPPISTAGKRTIEPTDDAADTPSAKRPAVVASVRPPTPYPHGEEPPINHRGQPSGRSSTRPTTASSSNPHGRVILSLNGCRQAAPFEPFTCYHPLPNQPLLVAPQQLFVTHQQTV